MRSLSAHLCRPADHGRLAFHPECPLCRGERSAGSLPAAAVVSRRAQAALMAGVLALSSVAPAAAFVAEGDQDHEGGATTEQVAVADSEAGVAADPGGASGDLPVELSSALEAPAAADPDVAGGSMPGETPVPSVGAAPATASDAPTPADPVPDDPQAPSEPRLGAASTAPTTPADPPATPDTANPVQGAAAPARPPVQAVRKAKPRRHAKPAAAARRPAATAPPSPQASAPAVGAPAASAAAASAAAGSAAATSAHVPAAGALVTVSAPHSRRAASASTEATRGRAAHRGDRVHVVLGGESLWSIAGDLLGDAASPARVAREVDRLWALNRDRIGTGNRDLVMAGTRLELA